MKFLTPCDRFKRLVQIDDDPELSTRDRQFLDQHRAACPRCKQFEITAKASRQAILLSAIDHSGTPKSTQKIVATFRSNSAKPVNSMRLPVLGAAAAAVMMGVILQMVSPGSPETHPIPNSTTQAPAIRDNEKELKLFEPDPGSTDLRRNDV